MIVQLRAPDMKQMERLIRLFHRRWSVPVLAEIHRAKGAKFITLVNRLGVSRTTLKLTLLDLIDAGLAMKNPGYGHPLRPEYVLPPESADLARQCARLDDLVRRASVEDTAFRKWSMPVLLTLAGGQRHFSQIRGGVPGISDRALTLALRALGEAGLTEREVLDGYPPRTAYRVLPPGRPLVAVLRRM